METVTIGYRKKELPAPQGVAQRKWQRVTLLGVLGYEAAGSLLGLISIRLKANRA